MAELTTPDPAGAEDDIREVVREKYAAAARATTDVATTDVEIRASHRVHERAASAIVRARKPAG